MGELQVLQLIVLVVLNAVDYPLASGMLVHFWKLILKDSWFVSLT